MGLLGKVSIPVKLGLVLMMLLEHLLITAVAQERAKLVGEG